MKAAALVVRWVELKVALKAETKAVVSDVRRAETRAVLKAD